VYCAQNPTAALLEILVHFEVEIRDLPTRYRLLRIDAPGDMAVERVSLGELPRDCRDLRSSHRPVKEPACDRRTVCVSLRRREETGDMLVPTEIRLLRAEDAATLANVASGVFDDALDQAATPEFLRDPRHHLAVAVDAGVVVGFASAVHYVHPDKPSPELWINEIGVAATHRGLGVGRALLEALLDVARQLGCVEAWVLTDRGNEPAMRLYKSGGGVAAAGDHVMFTFRL
jgi:GNAT superfamily N-acetyltransferase